MDNSEDTCKVNESKGVSMWLHEEFEKYARGNGITRKAAEDCLQQYSHKFKWPAKAKALDIGSGDGSVTKILSKYIPSDCDLTGSDINEKVVQYANENHGNDRLKFIKFDVLGDVPDNMKGQFDHVFSFYVFHFVKDHKKAFTNIYNILPKKGEFFAIFVTRSNIFTIFDILSKRSKWARRMEKVNMFISPYHQSEDPDIYVANMLKNIGFEVLDVRCKQRFFVHENIEDFKSLMTSINSFDIPKHMVGEFVDDIIDVKRYMNLIDESNGSVKTDYNLMLIHCRK